MSSDLEAANRHLDFLRGLFRGGRMAPGEAAEVASEGLLDILQGLATELEHLRAEVDSLREEFEALRAQVGEMTSADEDEPIACPSCGQRLAVGGEIASGKAIQVTCPSCNALLEVS